MFITVVNNLPMTITNAKCYQRYKEIIIIIAEYLECQIVQLEGNMSRVLTSDNTRIMYPSRFGSGQITDALA